MVNNNFYVMLEKEWFYSSQEQTLLQKYGTVSLMVYSIMLRNLTTRNTFNFSINGICSILKVDVKNNSVMVKNIKNAIRMLNDNLFTVCSDSNCNQIENLSKIDNNNVYYCIRKDEPLKDKFIMVYDTEIDKMLTYSKGKKNSVSELITHFSFIVNGFHGKEKDGTEGEGYLCYYGGMDYIEQKTGIENSTLAPDNKIFIEEQLLLIGNAGGSIEDNMYKNTSNVYCRYENKVEFDTFMKIKSAKLSSKFARQTDKEQQDKQRRLKQLINQYKKDNEIYEFDTKESLSEEQFNELHELEINYLNFVKSRDKELKNPKFLTIKRDGTIKEKYVPEELAEEEYIEPTAKGKGSLASQRKTSPLVTPIITPPIADRIVKANVKTNRHNPIVDFSPYMDKEDLEDDDKSDIYCGNDEYKHTISYGRNPF
ncbi:hypothetical protein [Clostridium tagluense]|uniref:Uncharacterized protein n=1 Tax=Clostridium tagluense TaxID=360422 RepID=A0A401UT40_9CLOT|nr:hypothetical protein [Clostridium tagluense]GCD12722.1 hypothetical protein Ctaglu_43450 [Clostridium tagluense]